MKYFLLILTLMILSSCAGWDKCHEDGKQVDCSTWKTHETFHHDRN